MTAATALKADDTEQPQSDRRQSDELQAANTAEDVSSQDVENFNLDAAIEGLRSTQAEMNRQEAPEEQGDNKAHIWDIPIEIEVIIGTLSLTVSDLLAMEVDAAYPLSQRADQPLQLVSGGKVLGQCELIAPDQEGESLSIRIVGLSNSSKAMPAQK